MLEGVQCPTHGEDGKGMIFNSMLLEPDGVFKHWEPPFLQHAFHRPADIVGANRVDQRLWVGTRENESLLPNDMALNDPVTAALIQIELPFVDSGAGSTARVMAANIPFGDVRAFQFRSPLESAFPEAMMHRLKVRDGFVRQRTGSDDQEINIAGFEVEVSAGERAI